MLNCWCDWDNFKTLLSAIIKNNNVMTCTMNLIDPNLVFYSIMKKMSWKEKYKTTLYFKIVQKYLWFIKLETKLALHNFEKVKLLFIFIIKLKGILLNWSESDFETLTLG